MSDPFPNSFFPPNYFGEYFGQGVDTPGAIRASLTGAGGIGASIEARSARVIEANWPGTRIPRSKFKAMQREALVRYLNDERKRLAEEPKPSKTKTKKAVKRVIERVDADGLLSPSQLASIRPSITEALISTASIEDILQSLSLVDQIMSAAQMAMDDEAAAFLLLAA